MKKIYGSISLQKETDNKNIFDYSVENGDLFEDDRVVIVYVGRIYSVSSDILKPIKRININEFKEIYLNNLDDFTKYIDGHSIIVIFDKKINKAFFYQCGTVAPNDLYYYLNKNNFYFSTSLKKILLLTMIKRELNSSKIGMYLFNGFIPDKETLIKGIYKLLPNELICLDLRNKNIQVKKAKIPEYAIDEKLAVDNYFDILKNVIENDLKDKASMNLCLSVGYDSNLLLHIAHQFKNTSITAFSVGGKHGIDESKGAEMICEIYKDVQFSRGIVSNETLDNFPDIVWRLEGTVSELGVFLQYELAREVSKQKNKLLFCGEGSDQVHNTHYHSFLKKIRPRPKKARRLSWVTYPYEVLAFLVMKKNGLMLNSFSLEGIYPYCYKIIFDIGKALRKKNGPKKDFQKSIVKAHVKNEIYDIIQKVGGSTEMQSIFEDAIDSIKLVRKVRSKIPFEKKYFDMDFIQPINSLSIVLFNELYISGKYDSSFDQPSINVSLNEILG